MAHLGIKNSIGLRLTIIAVLTLLFLIPAVMIQSLITERKARRNAAANEISASWGGAQTLVGPIISVPYLDYAKDDDNNIIATTQYAHFLPEDLQIKGALQPEIRYRGIYKVVVYNSVLTISGSFDTIKMSELNIPEKDVLWNDAFFALGISDMKGIKEFIYVDWNGTKYKANPGIESNDVVAAGISVFPDIQSTAAKSSFSMEINLNGSDGLFFIPVGKETIVELSSSWSNPSFTGSFLPNDRRVGSDGFNAEWKVLHLNRNFPQKWKGAHYKIDHSFFGVKLRLAVDEYQKIMRTAKYAILFITLTFLTFFMIELLGNKVIHPIQYILIGLALLIFYSLLLSISEYLTFKFAYVTAGAAIILLISLYTKTVLNSTLQTATIAGVLVLLYGYLYILLQLQDFALLLGSIGLFVVLAVVMYLTRKVDWFTIMSNRQIKES